VNYRYAPGKSGDPKLQAVLVVLVLSTVQLAFELTKPRVHVGLGARPPDERGGPLRHGHLGRLSQVFDPHVLQRQPGLGADHRAAQQGCQVFEFGDPAVAEARCSHHN
jgi:hypothetical protein